MAIAIRCVEHADRRPADSGGLPGLLRSFGMNSIYDRVLAYIADPGGGDFEQLALDVFRHQLQNCAPYREYCHSRGHNPDDVVAWHQVPPVPIQAFKWADLRCGPPERVFLSTGTTQGVARRSRHSPPDIRLYRASAIAGLRRHLFPDIEQIDLISLIPPVAEHPESSLAQMAAWAAETFASDTMLEGAAGGEFAFDLVADRLHACERRGSPVAILTTTAALIRFLDHATQHRLVFRLPHGSRIMDTGGAKGAPRPMSRRGLLHAVWNSLAIPGYFAVNEYGMAELSSQLYDSVVYDRFMGIHRARHLMAPPWLRAVVLDMKTLEPARPGSPGLICHFDLANAGTAMAVLSEDVGVSDGRGLRLLGRAPRAEVRGCSLSAAAMYAS